jgi:hypothetical protein
MMKAALAIAALIALSMTGCQRQMTWTEIHNGRIVQKPVVILPLDEYNNSILKYRAPHIKPPVETRDC